MDNRCVLRIGPDIMFFTGYQPQNSRDEFCDDILSTGQTVVALDMQDTELRNMLAEIRIIRDDGTHTRMNGLPVLTDAKLASKEVLDPVTINYLPPKKYPTSTLTLTYLPRERKIHRCRDGAKRTGRCCGAGAQCCEWTSGGGGAGGSRDNISSCVSMKAGSLHLLSSSGSQRARI